jgi:hypothetical protein
VRAQEGVTRKFDQATMAYAFGFPKDVTDRIYSMRDWRLEEVKAKRGTKLSREIRVWHDPPPPLYFNKLDLAEQAKYGNYDWSGVRVSGNMIGVGFFQYEYQDEARIARATRPYNFESYTESKDKKLNIRASCKELSKPVDHFVCQPCDDEESRIMMRRINAQ